MSATGDILKLYKESYSEEDVQEESPHNMYASMNTEVGSMDDDSNDYLDL
jgi:hypothetical protein